MVVIRKPVQRSENLVDNRRLSQSYQREHARSLAILNQLRWRRMAAAAKAAGFVLVEKVDQKLPR